MTRAVQSTVAVAVCAVASFLLGIWLNDGRWIATGGVLMIATGFAVFVVVLVAGPIRRSDQ